MRKKKKIISWYYAAAGTWPCFQASLCILLRVYSLPIRFLEWAIRPPLRSRHGGEKLLFDSLFFFPQWFDVDVHVFHPLVALRWFSK